MNFKHIITDFLDYLRIKKNNPTLPIKRKISGLFYLKEVIPQNTAKVTVSNSITIITDSEEWSYAAFLPLNRKKITLSSSPAIILIKGVVKHGNIGIGIIKKDFQSLVDEMIRAQKDSVTSFCLFVDQLDECFGLMIRNGSPNNESSEVEILSILVIQLKRLDKKSKLSSPPNHRLEPDTNWNRYYGVTPETMIEKVRLWEYKEIKEPMVMRWIENLFITIYPGNEIHEALYMSGLYEPNTMLAVQKLVSPGCVFLDIGANIGCYTLFTSRIVGSTGCVCAFEPSSREYRRLVENIRINDLTNVIPVNAAVAETQGKRMMTIACEHHSVTIPWGNISCTMEWNPSELRRWRPLPSMSLSVHGLFTG